MGFDGSSIRGWQGIHVSDMLAIPDAATAVIDPFFKEPTVSVIANIVDPITKEDYSRDPRHVARKGAAYLKKTGIADTCYIGPEPEFFIFDEVRYEQNQHTGMYLIDSVEGSWNTARFEEPNLGYKPSFKGGYFPVSPTDTYQDLRGEMVREMQKVGGGRIVCMASVGGTELGAPTLVAYCASKAGIAGLIRAMAFELAPFKININALAPGHVLSPMNEYKMADPEYKKACEDSAPLKRIGYNEDVTPAAIFLASMVF